MENINDILARAAALRDETALNSIDPARAGGIMYDTLIALNDLWLQQGAALVISKIYASVAAMQADTAPVSDLTGQPIHAGQIVVIASSDADNGSVYRFNGVTGGVSSWSLVGNIGSQCVGVTENTNTGGDDLHVGGSVIKAINAGYQFMGLATPSSNPGTPDQKIFYIASTPGTYTGFGNLSVNDGEIAMLMWNTSWAKLSIALSQAIRIAIAPNEVVVDPEDSTSFETQFGATAEDVLKHGFARYDGGDYPVYYLATGSVGEYDDDYGYITFVGGLQGISVYTIELKKIAGEVCPTSFKTFELMPDTVPTEASENPVSSGGVYAALNKCKYVSIAKNPMLLTVNNPSNPTVLIESELGCTIDDLLSVGQARSGADNNPVYYTISGGLFKQSNAYSGTISLITDKTVFILSLMTGYLVDRTVFELRATDATLAKYSTNPIQNGAVYNALASKQDTLSGGDGILVNGSTIASKTFGNGTATGAVRQINPDDEAGSPIATASGEEAVALGSGVASGYRSIAGGTDSEAEGDNSIAMGDASQAQGQLSTAIGAGTLALNEAEVAIGQYNASSDDSGEETTFTVGIGESDEHRANALEVRKSGKTYIKGVGGYNGTNPQAGTNDIQTVLASFVTRSVNNLVNYYLKSETYTKLEVQALISAISQFRYELVNSLPTASAETMGIIYLVPSSTQSQNNIKDEYITIESGGVYTWEQIGSTAIDLSNYVTTTALNTALADYTTTSALTLLLAGKQDKLTFDNVPTENSINPVKSGGVYSALEACKYISIAKNPMLLYVNDPSNPMVLIESELGCTLDDLMKVGYAREGTNNNSMYYSVTGFKPSSNEYANITFIQERTVFRLSVVNGYLVQREVFDLRAIDSTLSASSVNSIQNKAVYNALSLKQDTLTFDNVPTANSNNPVKSSGIKTAIDGVNSNISAAIESLTLLSDAFSIESASNLSISDAAEALGISEDNFNSLVDGEYFSFAYGSAWEKRLAVTKIDASMGGEQLVMTVVLGNNDIKIVYYTDSAYVNITVN